MLLWWLGGKLLIFFRRPSIRRTGVISGGLNMGQSVPSRFSTCWSCDLICIPKIRSDVSHCKHVKWNRDKFVYFKVRIKTMSKRPSIGMHSLYMSFYIFWTRKPGWKKNVESNQISNCLVGLDEEFTSPSTLCQSYWKQEIPSLWNHSDETQDQTPNVNCLLEN